MDVRVPYRPADSALMSQPFVAVARDDNPDLRRAVVLEDDRTEPLDHTLLDVDRAGRGSVHDALERA